MSDAPQAPPVRFQLGDRRGLHKRERSWKWVENRPNSKIVPRNEGRPGAGDGAPLLQHGFAEGRSSDWLKFKNPEAPAVKRQAEEDWSR